MIGDSTFSNGSTFSGCSSLESIDLPDKITCIHANSFSYCSSLKEIVIPKSVTYIEGYAFAYCSNLNQLLFLIVLRDFQKLHFMIVLPWKNHIWYWIKNGWGILGQ